MLYVQEDVEEQVIDDAEGRDGRAERRRSLAAVDRCRPGDRRRRAGDIATIAPRRRQDEGRLIAQAATRRRAGCFVAPHCHPGRRHRAIWSARSSARCCTSRPSRPTTSTASSLPSTRRLRADLRPPHPHRRPRAAHRRPASRVGNIYVNRNQIGAVVGVAALRRRRAVGHRAEGRRAALSAAISTRPVRR